MYGCATAVAILVLGAVSCADFRRNWDIAVTSNNQIELLSENGTLLGTTMDRYSRLKALAYDNIRHRFLVGGRDSKNDTIYNVKLSSSNAVVEPIATDLPDDVQGIAIDLLKNTVYWTDSLIKSIRYSQFDGRGSKLLYKFDEEVPQDVAIDSCKRILYWTNRNTQKASIESINLDTLQRKVIIDYDVHFPSGITVDTTTGRIFWVDVREGIYYRVESISDDGTDRQVVLEGTHQRPFKIAVNDDDLFWTDINNNVLWTYPKNSTDVEKPVSLRTFSEKPWGLVVRSQPNCPALDDIPQNGSSSEETFDPVVAQPKKASCLNGGQETDKGCKCPRGFAGDFCENSLCYNYCLHGDCYVSSVGYPQCRCSAGFMGWRCDKQICDNFCLNDGVCKPDEAQAGVTATCKCKEGFSGRRCERNESAKEMCSSICSGIRKRTAGQTNPEELGCRCNFESNDDSDEVQNSLNIQSNYTAAEIVAHISDSVSRKEMFDRLYDPVFLVMCFILLSLLALVVGLSMVVCRLRRRPRIKKRIIVNKNVTPLTYRPQQSEQCEITIENCCNMNICETPCFEPSQIRGFQRNESEDKKNLLSNIEAEDIY